MQNVQSRRKTVYLLSCSPLSHFRHLSGDEMAPQFTLFGDANCHRKRETLRTEEFKPNSVGYGIVRLQKK